MNFPDDRVRKALNERDVATLERAVKHYQSLGLEASLGMAGHKEGRAAIWYVDPKERSASTYQLEIEKYSAGWEQSLWVIAISRSNGPTMTMRGVGQVSSNILLFALTKAEQSIAASRNPHKEDLPQEDLLRQGEISRSEFETLDKLDVKPSDPNSKSNLMPRKSAGSWRNSRQTGQLTDAVAALETELSVYLQAKLR